MFGVVRSRLRRFHRRSARASGWTVDGVVRSCLYPLRLGPSEEMRE